MAAFNLGITGDLSFAETLGSGAGDCRKPQCAHPSTMPDLSNKLARTDSLT
jgi:hypothetical protein